MNGSEYVRRGDELMAAGHIAAAVECFATALRLDPGDPDAHFGIGFCAYQSGDDARAVSALTTCIELRPESPSVATAYMMRCMARANLQDRVGAMEDYREAVSRDPMMAEIIESMTCVGTAQLAVLAAFYPARMARIAQKLTALHPR